MIKALLDSSVIIAAIRSPTGGSAEILRSVIAEAIAACISEDIIEEVRRHFTEKLPGALPLLDQLIELVPFILVPLTPEEVRNAALHTPAKDAHVVAAATKAEVHYLVTLDKKHLLDNTSLKQAVNFQIVPPGELLRILRSPS